MADYPSRAPFSSLRELSEQGSGIQGLGPFTTHDFAVLNGVDTSQVMGSMIQPGIPYRFDDYRFIIFLQGEVEITVNLLRKHFQAPHIIYAGAGSIIQFDKILTTPLISGVMVSGDYLRMGMGGQLPSAMNGSQRDFSVTPSEEEHRLLLQMVDTLQQLCKLSEHENQAKTTMIATIVNYICGLYDHHVQTPIFAKSRAQQVFDGFIRLVNEHASRQHTLRFYADRLFITERYMSKLILQASNTPAKEWIDRAIVTSAKVALKYSDISIANLSDELSFPNVSFFCKFFKRMTGMTPTAYRDS